MPETIIQGGVSVFGLVVSGYDTIADLRSQPIADSPLWTKRSLAMTFGSAAPLDGTFGFYAWDPTSVAADDGVNVIKPTLITGEGRWRLIGSTGGMTEEVCIEGDNVCFGGDCPDQVLGIKNEDTGLFNRIDVVGADGDQTIQLGEGEVCISPTSFNCVDGECVDPGDGSGTYSTFLECLDACGAPVPPTFPGELFTLRYLPYGSRIVANPFPDGYIWAPQQLHLSNDPDWVFTFAFLAESLDGIALTSTGGLSGIYGLELPPMPLGPASALPAEDENSLTQTWVKRDLGGSDFPVYLLQTVINVAGPKLGAGNYRYPLAVVPTIVLCGGDTITLPSTTFDREVWAGQPFDPMSPTLAGVNGPFSFPFPDAQLYFFGAAFTNGSNDAGNGGWFMYMTPAGKWVLKVLQWFKSCCPFATPCIPGSQSLYFAEYESAPQDSLYGSFEVVFTGKYYYGAYALVTPVLPSAAVLPCLQAAEDQLGIPATFLSTCASPAGPFACAFDISPLAISVGRAGGTGLIALACSEQSCAWTAVSGAAWAVVTSAASGNGDTQVLLSFSANPGPIRSTNITVGGIVCVVTQQAGITYNCILGECIDPGDGTGAFTSLAACQAGCPCTAAITPISASFPDTGGSATVAVDTGSTCNWTAVSNDGWITVDSGTPGTGDGTVGYTVAANPGAARDGTITVAGETLSIHQSGGGPVITSPDYFWAMEETGGSDTRVDDIAAKTLLPTGTITGVAGLIGNAAKWDTGSNARFNTPGASAIPYTLGDDFSFNFWIKQNAEDGNEMPEFQFNTGITNFCRLRRTSAADEIELRIRGNGLGSETLTINPLTFDTSWHMWTIAYDGTTGLASLYRDAVLLGTTAALRQLVTQANSEFSFLGHTSVESLVDLFGAWLTYKLTPTEITDLYNGGAGLTWPF